MHVRTQIRAAIRDKLSAVAGLQDRITFDLPAVADEEELPFAHLWLGNENIEAATLAGKRLRSLEIFVDLIGRDAQSNAEPIDDLCERVENAMDTGIQLDALTLSFVLAALTVEYDNSGAQRLVRYRLQYQTEYQTDPGAAGVAI